MKYIVCKKPGVFEYLEKEAPKKKVGEALVKIHRVGICGTDLHAYSGNQAFFSYPRILGHELAATVLEIEANHQDLKVGDPVAILPYMACQHCQACIQGKTNCCENMQVLGVHTDGGMQEIISIPSAFLLPAPHLSLDEIALIEPLSIAFHALRRAGLQKGEHVLVIGCGPIGVGILKLAQAQGATVVAMDVNAARLQFAKKALGIENTVLTGTNAADQCRDFFDGKRADIVFDATGNKKALETGHHYMSHGGRYVLVGLYKADLTFLHPEIHAKETSLLCSRNATREDFVSVMDFLASGEFPTANYITHRVNKAGMIQHFERWLLPETGVLKAMVAFD